MNAVESCGVYHRTRDGRWLYPWGEDVPGAADLTVGDALRLGLPVGGGDRHDRVIGMSAPELDVRAMLTTADIADLMGVAPDTVAAYRHRGYLPEPQATVGRTPVWSRPVMDHWIKTRPGSGWRTDMYGDREEYVEYLHHHRTARQTRRTATSASA